MTLLAWPDFGLFDYEYNLARREVAAFLGVAVAHETPQGLIVHDSAMTARLVSRLTYFGAVVDGDIAAPTVQAAIETEHRRITGRRGTKQSTRYLVHDLHEYKGKFNPQMARALMNVFGTDADVVIDPFSGSGTTAIEAVRLGKSVVALDMNPLAAWMTRVKVDTLTSEPVRLRQLFTAAAARATIAASDRQLLKRAAFDELWPSASSAYLERWFPNETLHPMARVLRTVTGDRSTAGDLVRLAVSNTIRTVSWQLPEDLRIRRRPAGWVPPVYVDVLRGAFTRINHALAEQESLGALTRPQRIVAGVGDARNVDAALEGTHVERRIVITSPPYATALPYIDTDRLSLVALSLVSPSEVRALEGDLTGSREWTTAAAAGWTARMRDNADSLPDDVVELCARIERRNEAQGAGFRRVATPALLYRYFTDMTAALRSWAQVLSSDERAVLVVGSNRTGGHVDPIEIDTPSLTAHCAERVGFELEELIGLQVWPRYGLHARNGVAGESAVVLRRTA